MSEVFERITGFIHPVKGLAYSDIPKDIIKRNKWQVLSMIAAIIYGRESPYFRWIMKRLYPEDGKNPMALACALSTLSMLYDYDDFMFAAHSGHSSVITPLAFSGEFEINGKDFITLQTIGNEIGGRLGASIFLGTHNGQMWMPVHQIASASQLARLRSAGLKDDDSSNLIKSCITLSLAYPIYGMMDTFFGSAAKCMTSCNPLGIGIKSGLTGETGMMGADPFEENSSFYQAFSYLPLLTVWESLGSDFFSRTLSFKKFPGCAYIAAPVQACAEIYAQMKSADSYADGIDSVEIYCNILSKKMDDLSRPYLKGKDSTLTTLNFSLPINCSLMLNDGFLRPESFSRTSLSRDVVWLLAEKTRIFHDPEDSLQMLRHSSPIPNSTSLFLKHPLRLLPFYKKYGGLKDLASMPADIRRSRALKGAFSESRPMITDDSEYRFYNGATVVVRVKEGSDICRHVGMPEGFAGTPDDVVYELLSDKLNHAAGYSEASPILDAINNLEHLDSADVQNLLKQVKAMLKKPSGPDFFQP